jgi:ABC-type antimicrobial peptide transport system permease subunit
MDGQELVVRTVLEGVLMKLGDVILISGSGAAKKVVVITILLARKKFAKKPKHKEKK